MADLAGECSEPTHSLTCLFVDPLRNASIPFTAVREPGQILTLADLLGRFRASENDPKVGTDPILLSPDLDRTRLADGLFLLRKDGTLGDLIPGLRFKISGRSRSLDDPLPLQTDREPISIEIDRSQTGYTRDWSAFLSRRWGLRKREYEQFVRSILEQAYDDQADLVLQLDSPVRVHQFLSAVARRIHDAPYETYSRFLDNGAPFKSCDQTLDRLLLGDGGNCSEKAMALYLIAHAHGIQTEIVFGGEDAKGPLPYQPLRSILDQRTFHDPQTRVAQRFWQHYALLFHPTSNQQDDIFCDVAGSNIPFLCIGADEAAVLLDPKRTRPLRVVITLEPIQLYYQRIEHQQDLALDLSYAMEHFIEDIDIIHAIDNELGLLHTGDHWIGAVAYRDRDELARVQRGYERFVRKARLDPRTHLCFTDQPLDDSHRLVAGLLQTHPAAMSRIEASADGLRRRIEETHHGASTCYVFLKLRQ